MISAVSMTLGACRKSTYQGEIRMLDSPEGVYAPMGSGLVKGRGWTGPMVVGLWLMAEGIVGRRPGLRFGDGSHAPIRAPKVGSA